MVLLILSALCMLILLTVLALEKSEGYSIVLLFFTVLLLSGVYFEAQEKGYKQGQVDALTGKVKYELVVNADSTKTWEEVK